MQTLIYAIFTDSILTKTMAKPIPSKMNRLPLIIFVILAFQACTKDDISQTPISADAEKVESFLQSKSANITESPIPLDNSQVTFVENISYGNYDENVFDIFIPQSATPVPLVIYIHGGGFLGGSRVDCYEPKWGGSWDLPAEINELINNDIAFATIDYRLLEFSGDSEGVKKSLLDSKRCLQFIRRHSAVLNIDKTNIVLCGSSAGAGTAQWIAFQDDMADLSNPNPLFWESTRVKGIAVKATQASYNLKRYETVVFADYDFSWQDFLAINPNMITRINSFYGMTEINQFYTNQIKKYRKRLDMLDMMSSDDPEFWVANLQPISTIPTDASTLNHHAYHARTMKEYADEVGIPNVTYYGNGNGDYADPSGESFVDFMIRKIEE